MGPLPLRERGCLRRDVARSLRGEEIGAREVTGIRVTAVGVACLPLLQPVEDLVREGASNEPIRRLRQVKDGGGRTRHRTRDQKIDLVKRLDDAVDIVEWRLTTAVHRCAEHGLAKHL